MAFPINQLNDPGRSDLTERNEECAKNFKSIALKLTD